MTVAEDFLLLFLTGLVGFGIGYFIGIKLKYT